MVYAIDVDDRHYCLVDAGVSHADQILANIAQTSLKGKTPSHLILTHAHIDHIGAAHQFKSQFPKIRIYAHDWDASAIEGVPGTESKTAASWYGIQLQPVPIHHKFTQDKEILTIGSKKIEILHTPGHTPGSISVLYYTPAKELIVFGQDIHGPFLPEFESNINDWRLSMRKILALEPDILCEGHFGIFRGKEKVKKFIQSHLAKNG